MSMHRVIDDGFLIINHRRSKLHWQPQYHHRAAAVRRANAASRSSDDNQCTNERKRASRAMVKEHTQRLQSLSLEGVST